MKGEEKVKGEEKEKGEEKVKAGYKEALCSLEAMLAHDDDSPASSQLRVQIPGPEAGEKDYAQPYLLVLLRALGSIVDSERNPRTGSSPAKSHVQVDRAIPETQRRQKRVVDKSISANNGFLYLLRDDFRAAQRLLSEC